MTKVASNPRARRSRAKVARPAPTQPAQAKPNPEEALRDLLVPLANAAMMTSIGAYKWGLKEDKLMRASLVMDLCGQVLERANQILGYTVGDAGKWTLGGKA